MALTRLFLGLAILFIGACTRNPFISDAEQCQRLLDAAYTDLDRAQAKNPSATADIAHAAALISAATVQKQFDKQPNCIDKAQRARELLHPYLP